MAPPNELAPTAGARDLVPHDRPSAFHRRVESMCLDRLREALDPQTQLFDRQLRDGRWGRTRGTEDLTGTAICLLGVHRAGVDPAALSLDPRRSIAALVERWRAHAYPGALGLLVWANAVWDALPLERLLDALGVSAGHLGDAGAPLTTMEAAWLVSGLAHEARRSGAPWTRVAVESGVAGLLARQHPGTHLFEHATEEACLAHRVRRHVANFADQIYAVQAAAFAAELAHPTALAAARACAARLVSLQGGLGQWWWHYDPQEGTVAQTFPVYSVHQHAMAPMALLALAAAGGPDHRAARERSYAWVETNESGGSLLDESAGTVWRSIERLEPAVSRFARHARSVARWRAADEEPPRLTVNHETRPYEWAWCLFAGALTTGPEPRGDAA